MQDILINATSQCEDDKLLQNIPHQALEVQENKQNKIIYYNINIRKVFASYRYKCMYKKLFKIQYYNFKLNKFVSNCYLNITWWVVLKKILFANCKHTANVIKKEENIDIEVLTWIFIEHHSQTTDVVYLLCSWFIWTGAHRVEAAPHRLQTFDSLNQEQDGENPLQFHCHYKKKT